MNRLTTALLIGLLGISGVMAYPIDGYDYTGIKRVLYTWRAQEGEIAGRVQPPGALLPMTAVVPQLTGAGVADITFEPDPDLSRQIQDALAEEAPDYAVALLDLSDPESPVYAELNGDIVRNVGSVGKLIVGLAWFQTMADVFPDIAEREALLRDNILVADEFVIKDHHKVLFFDPETNAKSYRTIEVGDKGSLWDWMDWMLSASNNGAAATMQEQVMLLKHFGRDYPPTPEQKAKFFEETTYAERGELFQGLMNSAVERNGMDTALFRQGSFFTRTGNSKAAVTSSHGNVRELVRYLYLMERGNLVDEWSSRELKRLLYMTQRRIRYASHPVLNPFAVYFKSGSLYKCRPEEGFTCGQYMGNELNLLASIAIVEGPTPGDDYHYLVAVSSNVLRKNSAVAHQTLALRVHRMVEARNKARLEAEQAAAASALAPQVLESATDMDKDTSDQAAPAVAEQ